jgi:hypothetical protein
MEHVMVTFQSFRKSVLSSLGLGHTTPDFETLRSTCYSLLDDVPATDRKVMLQRLEKMRRADDLWHLRGALFDTISRFHGEAVARKRLATLDDSLR